MTHARRGRGLLFYRLLSRLVCRALPASFSMPLTLSPSTRLAPLTAPILLLRPPVTPVPGRLPALVTAIPALRTLRLKPLFAALQQAPPRTPRRMTAVHTSRSGCRFFRPVLLTGPRFPPTVLWVHGKSCSPTIKSREEVGASSRGVFFPPCSPPQPPPFSTLPHSFHSTPPATPRSSLPLTPSAQTSNGPFPENDRARDGTATTVKVVLPVTAVDNCAHPCRSVFLNCNR